MTQDEEQTKSKPDEHGDGLQSQLPKEQTSQNLPGNRGAPDEQGESDREGRHGRPSDDSDPGHS
ncbi:hypothetical protein [Deinococcus yavapaiensis]|uniref:Uncharacterized protein n=1 Tax=Deinococcus yavapaiensis KR-236 TaxID=694435 RepID=A0A318SAS3_9DEIO|nr:hypothetical protein [Deinococcus yavapaiensis]PYE53638.1 hypothetical protein DES52_108169 [Deinococcus yavapaiensis KR-236]